MTDFDERQVEMARLDYEFYKQEFSDRLRIQETLGTAGLKALMLVNGGALIALFTFIGNSGAGGTITNVDNVWQGFAAFVGGLVAAVAAHITAYFMQANFGYATTYEMWNSQAKALRMEPKHDGDPSFRVGTTYMIVTVILILISLLLFCIGSGLALAGVTRL